MIRCSSCNEKKQPSDFYKDKNKKRGYRYECIGCNKKAYKNYGKEYRIKNKPVLNLKSVKRCYDYLARWEGLIPKTTKCEICGKQIYFNSGDRKKAIHFDHRNGGCEAIKIKPTKWLRSNPRSEENDSIWKSCKFGMLCHSCNMHLPTKNRIDFLDKALLYSRDNLDE